MSREIAADLDLAQRIATRAARIAEARFQAPDLRTHRKLDGSPVTDADLDVERAIRRELQIHRPDDGILGEELGSMGSSEATWIVDPIDGTQNFLDGSRHWGIQIALRVDGQVILGVIEAPLLDCRWWAGLGMGAYRDGERLTAAATTALDGALITRRTGAPLRPDEIPSTLLARLTSGRAAGPHVFWPELLVAEGIVDIDIGNGGAEWDLAPRHIIVTESGALFTDLRGDPGIVSGRSLSANPTLHRALVGVAAARHASAGRE